MSSLANTKCRYPKSFNNSSEDGKLDELMEMVGLSYLAEREGGYGSWNSLLNLLLMFKD